MKVTITQTLNGYTVEDEAGMMAFEVIDEIVDGADTVARMLWYIIEILGVAGSRHDKKRVRIVVEPGDKAVEELE